MLKTTGKYRDRKQVFAAALKVPPRIFGFMLLELLMVELQVYCFDELSIKFTFAYL